MCLPYSLPCRYPDCGSQEGVFSRSSPRSQSRASVLCPGRSLFRPVGSPGGTGGLRFVDPPFSMRDNSKLRPRVAVTPCRSAAVAQRPSAAPAGSAGTAWARRRHHNMTAGGSGGTTTDGLVATDNLAKSRSLKVTIAEAPADSAVAARNCSATRKTRS